MTAQWRLEDAYLENEGMKDVKSKLSNSKEPPSKRERESEGALSTLFRRAKGKIGVLVPFVWSDNLWTVIGPEIQSLSNVCQNSVK